MSEVVAVGWELKMLVGEVVRPEGEVTQAGVVEEEAEDVALNLRFAAFVMVAVAAEGAELRRAKMFGMHSGLLVPRGTSPCGRLPAGTEVAEAPKGYRVELERYFDLLEVVVVPDPMAERAHHRKVDLLKTEEAEEEVEQDSRVFAKPEEGAAASSRSEEEAWVCVPTSQA